LIIGDGNTRIADTGLLCDLGFQQFDREGDRIGILDIGVVFGVRNVFPEWQGTDKLVEIFLFDQDIILGRDMVPFGVLGWLYFIANGTVVDKVVRFFA